MYKKPTEVCLLSILSLKMAETIIIANWLLLTFRIMPFNNFSVLIANMKGFMNSLGLSVYPTYQHKLHNGIFEV